MMILRSPRNLKNHVFDRKNDFLDFFKQKNAIIIKKLDCVVKKQDCLVHVCAFRRIGDDERPYAPEWRIGRSAGVSAASADSPRP